MSTAFEPCVVDGVRCAAFQNCAINVWAATSSEVTKPLAKLDELVRYVCDKHKEGAVFFVVITPGNPVPNSAQRKELEAFYARWAPSWRAVANVAEGNDLWSVTARSVMTTMRLLQRKPYPNKVFSDVGEAAQWASEYVVRPGGQSMGDAARDLQGAVEQLRRMAF